MPDIVYSYKTVPTIKRFSESNLPIRGLMGPFGSGKSSGCVIELVKRAAAQPPNALGIRRSRWAVVRNTYRQLQDTTIKTFHQWLPPVHFGEWKSSTHDYLVTGLAKDIHMEVMFRALDRPEHVANLLSLELTGAWANEAREIPWTIIKALLGRTGRFPPASEEGCAWWGVILDTNPPDDESWFYQLFEEKLKPGTQEPLELDVAVFKQPSGTSDVAENLNNLRKGYYLDLAKTMDQQTAKVYVHGDYGYVQDGKPVYPEYKDALHCSDVATVKPGLAIYRGWDFGLTPACVFSQLHPSGRWVTFDELTADSLGIDRFSDQVLAHCSINYPGHRFEDIADPSGDARKDTDERTCFAIMRGKGIEVTGGEQTLAIRTESVKWALRQLVDGQPMVQIHPRCKKLRKGYQGRYKYRRVQVSVERYVDEPEKDEYSHPHDANQYVATRLFAGRVRAAGVDLARPEPVDRYSRRRRSQGTAWAA